MIKSNKMKRFEHASSVAGWAVIHRGAWLNKSLVHHTVLPTVIILDGGLYIAIP